MRQQQRHDASILVEQPADTEAERLEADRRQRLHFDVLVLVGLDGLGPLPGGDRLQVGHQQQRIGAAQRLPPQCLLDHLLDVVAGRVGQQQGGTATQGHDGASPDMPAPHS